MRSRAEDVDAIMARCIEKLRQALRDKAKFSRWIDDDQSIRLRDLRCDFGQVLGTRHAN
jgi:hypothetical protein